jgi:hypothetical protein
MAGTDLAVDAVSAQDFDSTYCGKMYPKHASCQLRGEVVSKVLKTPS